MINTYIISVIFSIIILMYVRISAVNRMDRILKILSLPGDSTFNHPEMVVFVPVVNILTAMLLMWIITAPDKSIDKLIEFLSKENNKYSDDKDGKKDK